MKNKGFLCGFEHEVAFIKGGSDFSDATNTTFEYLSEVVKSLPLIQEDLGAFRIGDLKIKEKRWYVEGYERLDVNEKLLSFIPKGIEIRTTPESTIKKAALQLEESFKLLTRVSSQMNLEPVWISYNPIRSNIPWTSPLTDFEKEKLNSQFEQTELRTIYSFGPDINISFEGLSDKELVDIGRKLTYYSPFIVPFSFSSPFLNGKLWDGLSYRTFVRTGDRHAARVFLGDSKNLIPDNPLTALMRIPMEKGRIEFKAFDSCCDFNLIVSLAALIKGLALDTTLMGRADVPDKALHQTSAREGFKNEMIFSEAERVVWAVLSSLADDADRKHIELLSVMLKQRSSPSMLLIEEYKKSGDVIGVLKGSYGKFNRTVEWL